MTRFGIEYEQADIDAALNEQQGEWGVEVQWHRWDESSPVHDVYDVGEPRQWSLPIEVPVQFALVLEGGDSYRDAGLRTVNTVVFAVSIAVFRDRLGWNEDLSSPRGWQSFLKDRVAYGGSVFTVDSLEPIGDLKGRDVMISGRGREVHEDTLVIDEEVAPE